MFKKLENKHVGKTCYIVGCGESLKHLKSEHFGKGVVIALNKSITDVNDLELSIPVYSQQKDGNLNGKRLCSYPNCNFCTYVHYPAPATLLVHKHESIQCWRKYRPRIVFDNLELGLQIIDFSALTATRIAQYMGCNHIVFLCFDSIEGNFNGKYSNGRSKNAYEAQIRKQKEFLKGISHEFVTPKP